MYARFRVSTGASNGYGIHGITNSIKALGLAAAGETVAKPSGVTVWNHIGKEEAGGHTLVAHSNTSTTSHSGYIEMSAPSAKEGYTRKFRYKTNTSSGTYAGAQVLNVSFVRNGTTSYSENLSYITSTSSGWMPQYWYQGNFPIDRLDWHVSITADYFYIWYNVPADVSSSYPCNHAGFADLNFVPSTLLETSNAFFPSVATYSCSEHASYWFGYSSTNYYRDWYLHSQLVGDNGNATSQSFANQSNMKYTRNTSSLSMNWDQSAPGHFGPPYWYSDGSNVSYPYASSFTHTYDANGKKVGSLTPYIYFNPFAGIPYTTLKGISHYEVTRRKALSYNVAPNYFHSQNEIMYDSDGTRHVLQFQPNNFGIRAFRAV